MTSLAQSLLFSRLAHKFCQILFSEGQLGSRRDPALKTSIISRGLENEFQMLWPHRGPP